MGSEGRIDLRNFIGGEFTENEGGAWMDVVEPATGMAYARTPLSGDVDVDRAVEAARSAQPGWGSLSHKERAEWLDRIADALEARHCLLYTSPSPRDQRGSRMPSSA